MLIEIDAALLRIATRFAHWFQRWTGRTSFFLAKCGVMLWALECLIDLFNHYLTPIPGLPTMATFETVFTIVIILVAIARCTLLDKADAAIRAGARVLPAYVMVTRNSSAWWIRLLFVAMSLLTLPMVVIAAFVPYALIIMLRHSGMFGITAFEYFIMVDPLPPGVSKVRQWVASWTGRPRPIEGTT
jgi:hypothetical protein